MMMRPVAGGLEVFIPHWMNENDPDVMAFIERGKAELEEHVKPPPPYLTSESMMRAMVLHWSEIIGVSPGRVQFRTMYRKWGSCSRRGNITLATALFWLPPRLAEYVVLHELIHLIEFNHDTGFQRLMTRYMPDWRERRDEMLEQYSTFGMC